MKRRSNRFLMWALAISLATHAVFIYWAQDIKGGSAEPAPPPDVFHIEQHQPKLPPPEPIVTPKPVHVKPQTVAVVSPPITPASHNTKKGAGVVEPPVAPPGPPGAGPIGPDPGPGAVGPTESPAPSCTAPDVAAHTVDIVTPDTPEMAQEQGLTGTTLVQVALDPSGSVTDVSVYRSSGSQLLDNAALAAARRSTYRADIRDCEAVSGNYLFSVTFQ